MSKHVFFGKFCIEQVDGTDEYRVSAMPMSDRERDALAGIVRCMECCCYHQTHEDGTGICARHGHGTAPDAFCAWGERKEDNQWDL